MYVCIIHLQKISEGTDINCKDWYSLCYGPGDLRGEKGEFTFCVTLKNSDGDIPGGPVVRNQPSNAGDADLTPAWGTKIPHAVGQWSPCASAREKPECHKEAGKGTGLRVGGSVVLNRRQSGLTQVVATSMLSSSWSEYRSAVNPPENAKGLVVPLMSLFPSDDLISLNPDPNNLHECHGICFHNKFSQRQ